MKNPKDYAGLDAERQFAQRNHQPMEQAIDRKEDLQLDHDGQYKIDKEGGRIIDHVEEYEPTSSDHQSQKTHEEGLELPEEEERIIHDEEGVVPREGEYIRDEEYPTTNEEIIPEEEHPVAGDERNFPLDERGSVAHEAIIKNEQGSIVVKEPVLDSKEPKL